MEQSFSQRMGLKPIKNIIQINSMDEDLRKALWNDLTEYIIRPFEGYEFNKILRDLWIFYYKNLLDNMPSLDEVFKVYYKEHFFKCEWNEAYDLIEFTVKRVPKKPYVETFLKHCNLSLERELSAYRFIGKTLVPITSEQEIAAIEDAINVSKVYTQHLQRALELLADRKAPDYRNSIKESISAVEATCQLITGNQKVTLKEALQRLEGKLGTFHPALNEAFNKLYGYAGDAEGIRHALLGESNLDAEDAIFMLIICSAFINYLAAKAGKAGIELSHS